MFNYFKLGLDCARPDITFKMKHLALLISLLFITLNSYSQNLTSAELLNKAIKYHDPHNNWVTFNDTLLVTMESPKSPKRVSDIVINLSKEYFYVKAKRDTLTTEYTLDKESCSIALNGNKDLSEAVLKTNNLSCKRANLYKNYYTYLYGLPMKLKDAGTIIDDKVERKAFKGKDYLVLKVTYDEAVGKDIWFFYFDPKSYAMEIYQFYKTDENGQIKPESGEYILLTETTMISDIKMPKNRAWYYNKNDGYLGTDILN